MRYQDFIKVATELNTKMIRVENNQNLIISILSKMVEHLESIEENTNNGIDYNV